jgi:uncharacterized repeat protein (TIGR01451 family)
MKRKLQFGVVALAALATLAGGAGAVAADRSDVKSQRPAVAAAKLAGGLELIEYVQEAAPAQRAATAGSGGIAPSSALGAPSGPSEVEPNNSSATATPIAGTRVVLGGNVFPAADVDFYSFTAAAGDRIYAATQTSWDAAASGDTVIDVLNTDGATVIETDNNDGTFNASSASVAGTLIPAAGTYFLRVRHNVGTGTIRPYALHFRQQSAAPTAEVEPNNSTATATPIPASGHVSGTITAVSPGESDFFSINLNAGDSVYLSLDMNPERDAAVWNGRLGFALFGNPPANQILLANDANAGASAADPNSEAFFFTVKDAGTYYVYVDSTVATGLGANATYNLNVSVLPRVTPGGSCTTYTSTDVPQTIPTTAPPILVSSTITVPGNPRIADIDVAINLNHTFMQDLDVHLISPAGNDNGLFTDIGAATVGGAQTLMDIVLDDEAALPPAFAMSAPFHIQPELAYRLSWFDGSNAGGTWTLQIRDDASGDGGTLNAWSITVCEPPPPQTCPVGTVQTTVYSQDFEAGDGGFTHSGVQDEWERGLPTFAPITTCNSGVNCWKTDLDNTYNASSNQELLSPNINLAGLQPPVFVNWAQRYHMESASFDRFNVTAREVGGANPVNLFEWLDATMNNTVGSPGVTINQSAGWAQFSRRVDSLAGTSAELLFRLESDTTVQLAGVGIDDVSVTACRALSADLAITKTNGVASSVPGTPTTYTITASNAGPDPVPAATVADTFPAACVAPTWTCVGAGGGTCTANGAGNINQSVNLPAGGSVTFTAVCPIASTATGTLTNTATVSSAIGDPNAANNSATDTDTLTPQANLGITKTNGTTTVGAGSNTVYTIVASNAGPSAAPGSTVVDTFPAACTSVNWTCSGAGGGTCSAAGAGNINQAVNLPVGGSVTFLATCAVNIAAVGNLVNTATVAAAGGITDPTPGNNSATDTDTIVNNQADVSITKTDGQTTDIPGTSIAYTIVASNAGPGGAASVTVADTFPATLTGVTWTCAGAGGGTCVANGSGNINSVANLPAGGSVTYSVNATIAASATGTLSNTATATVGGGVVDPVPGNNSATDTTTLTAQSDLSITLTDSPDPVVAGTNLTYLATLTNVGPSDAQDATITLPLPAGTSPFSAGASAGGTCTSGNPSVCTWAGATAPGATRTATIVVTVNSGQTANLSATATAASTTTDPTPGNNTATAGTVVEVQADLSVTLTDAPDPVIAGTNLTYTAVVTNVGPSDATGVVLTLPTPTNTSFVSGSVTGGGACAGSPVVCTVTGSMLPNTSRTVTIVMAVAASAPEGSTISATATVTATSPDPVPGNNSASTTTAVITRADLLLGFSASVAQTLINVPVTFTATSLNQGPSDAQGVSVTITLTPDFRYSSHTAAGATCTTPQVGNTGAIVCTWAGATVPGVTRTLTVVAFSNVEGPTGVSASTTSNTIDPVPNNNSGNVVVQVGYLIEEIPTLSGYGLILLGLMFGLIGFVAVRRQA